MYELYNTGADAYWLLGVPSVHPNVTPNMLLLQHCYVIRQEQGSYGTVREI